ncbi:hypothetical protein ACIHFE_21510 [Streptomyces sp. NPDC052396]|uniref:hypothetical protein n=1 Tax=Streptomyces sp. NPDC052396 TaxID=3365689 RepID=UPI0037CF1261
MTTLLLSIRPAPLAAWFHHSFTRPVVEIDGAERPAKWGDQALDLPPGEHRLRVYFRYRGQRLARLAESGTDLTLPDARESIRLRARLGLPNGSRFRFYQG